MKALEHLRTINHHKWLVMKHCFKVGLYKQGLLHDMSKYTPTSIVLRWACISRASFMICPNIRPRNSWWAAVIIRVIAAPTTRSGRLPAILQPGSTTRAGISTIMNTGWITVWIPEKGSWGRRCPSGMRWRCSWTGWRLPRLIWATAIPSAIL